jgi:hypothetical protein
MSVAATQRTGQYAERPGGNRGELNGNLSAPGGALEGDVAVPLLTDAPGPTQEGCVMHTRPYTLAANLARPVARGYLTRNQADGCLLATAMRGARTGQINHDPVDVYRIARDILTQKLADMHARRELAAHHIRRLLEPMIGSRKPSRALLAESHGVNGEEGFPLTEEEVRDIVRDEVWWSLPIGGRRHG